MAFKRNDIKRISNTFSTDEKTVKEALYMCLSYLKNNDLNTYTVARAISIVIDKLQKIKKKENQDKLPYFGMKHTAIRKYKYEIVELYEKTIGTQNGWGWIAKELQLKHNIKVSRQTIKTFINRYEEWKLWQT